ncbi:efflux RND transporter permease subunit [Paenibacillus sp. y28]|uniref:efflux RND transporter permease subunit n=1 Tax=Paenibacillus sp. y28 TaxID=3129110 RepID=UPI003018582A
MIARLLRYRKITLLFFLMAVLVGSFSFLMLKQRENPEIAVTTAIVQTIYPGASPEKVEQLVTKPLEEKIKEMNHISVLSSTSAANVSIITVELEPGVDNEASWDKLRQKVQLAQADLPAEAHQPEVNDDLARIAAQIIHLVVDSADDLESLRPVSEQWKNQLRNVSGVSNVEVVGLPEQEIRVTLQMDKLEQYQLPWGTVMQALQAAHNRTPIGNINEDRRSVYLQLTGEWGSAEDISETIIYRTPGTGESVKLKDVAGVKLSEKKQEQHVYFEGKPAVDIVINAEKGQDVPSLQERIDVEVNQLQAQLSPDIHMESMFSQRESVKELFSELSRELLIGMIAVVIVCSLGLNLGTALIVSLAIPVSIAIGFIPVDALGIDLNQITVVSLVIVLGILVDDAIVVNDNIERRQQLGDTPTVAALQGSRDVAISITTATIATAAAFFPLFFLKGNIGDFIRPIPIVISLTLFSSMIMSLTVIPIFREWIGNRKLARRNNHPAAAKSGGTVLSGNGGQAEGGATGAKPDAAHQEAVTEHKSPGFLGKPLERLAIFYERQIHKFLARPILTGIISLVIGTSSFGLLPLLGVQYFPTADREEFLIDVKTPVGSTFAETDDAVLSIAAWVRDQPGVKSVSAYAGRTAPKFYYTENETTGIRTGQVFVHIDKKQVRSGELVKPWRQQLQAMYPDLEINPRELEQGPPVGAPIAIRISGPDLTVLRELSEQLQGTLSAIPGAVNVTDDIGIDMYTVDLELDRDKANYYGVLESDLSATVRLATEGVTASEFQLDDKLIDVTLYSVSESDMMQQALDRLTVPSQTGKLYPLSEFATLEPNRMINSISHRNLMRTVTVRSYTEDRLPDDIVKELNQQVSGWQLPAGYTMEFGGENEERNDAFIAIGQLSIIVMLLIYTIIAMQFYSLSIPILVLSTVYLAAGGALIGLYVTGAPIGFMALMGMVSLAGIVVRNGIVLVEFIEQAREHGLPLHEAIAQAGRARLRPILLTSATAVSGLTPMAIMGGSLWRPMAVTIIFGLIYSTVLTLIVVPSLYAKLAQWRDQRASRKGGHAAGHGSAHSPGTANLEM